PSLVGTGLYLLGILLPAIFGQSILNSDPSATGRGFFWYGVSLFFLLLLGWSRQESRTLPRLRLPTISDATGPVGFYAAGLVLSWLAFSFVNTPGVERPTIALALWLLAIVVSTYGFWPLLDAWPLSISRQTLIIAGGLFVGAAVVRFWGISNHPFIISGTEANIGREALMVNAGQWQNPFGTSFLTNPSLPLYLIGLPLRIFGRTTLAIRFWSAVLGALTVVATYLIGQKLWNRSVGITAAVLLAGSHWHIHYSRIGLTNVWDPLLTLVALGLLVLAWREKNRILWVLTGVALGFNAYLFTSSHILPLILIAFLMTQLLFNRSAFRANGRYLLMAGGLALVIALPLLLFYNSNETIFMERANQYGIFQTGWVGREAAQTGQSTLTVVWTQIKQSLLAFNATADASAYYGVNQPLLGFWAAIAFVLGSAIALFRIKKPQNLLLLLWVLVTAVFAGGLLIESPASHRLLLATPAVMLLAGLALSEFGQLLSKALPLQSATATTTAAPQTTSDETAEVTETATAEAKPRRGRYQTYQFVALALLAVAMVVPDLLFYFASYRQETTFGDPNTEIAHVLGSYMRDELTGDETLYFIAPPAMYVGFPTITFFSGEKFSENVNLFNVEPLASENAAEYLPDLDNNSMIFIVIPSRFSDLGALRVRYPEGTMRQIPGYYNDPLFIIYEVDPSN
ncbi:MAG: glycosyltransferase family 39 protein, partial [Anaerolineales bacterium]|nr:glycosyltransferase family 39 protein [Anaerolineales bacterium]